VSGVAGQVLALLGEELAHAETKRELAQVREERDALAAQNIELNDACVKLEKELERSSYKGCGSYPRAIGEIEGALGITRAVPLSETVDAVRKLAGARPILEAAEEASRRLLVMIESLEADEDGSTDNDLLLVDLDGIRSLLARRATREQKDADLPHGIPEGENDKGWPDGTPDSVTKGQRNV
jgi:hypothetical protein